MKRVLFASVIFFFSLIPCYTLTFSDIPTDNITDNVREWMQTAEGNQAPFVMDGFMLLSRESNPQISYQGIAFQHEQFRIVHKFLKNDSGTFIMAYKLPIGKSSVVYRLIKDGLWCADSFNRFRIKDARGFQLSCLPLTETVRDNRTTPFVSDGWVTFRHKGTPGSDIFLTGDFISWDPYTYKMEEIEPGLYEARIKLSSGIHRYYFLQNGVKMTDDFNPHTDYSRLEGTVSVFEFQ